jgi:hypothetical protein
MGGACGTTEGRSGEYRALMGRLKEGDHFEDLGVDERVILKMEHQEVEWGDMDWIAVAENRERGRALVNAVGDLGVP